MSATTEILNSLETKTAALLPSYKRLKYSYDLERNDSRGANSAYGIGASDGVSVTGTNRTITMDQSFFVVLSKKFGSRADDSGERVALKDIYDDLDTLYRDFFQTKLSLNNTVYLVSELSLDSPEKIGEDVISVRMNFIVKFRKSTD